MSPDQMATQETPVVSMRELITDGLRERARAYASSLVPGDHIIEDIDGPVIAGYRSYIPGALAARGLHLEQVVGGWRVKAVR